MAPASFGWLPPAVNCCAHILSSSRSWWCSLWGAVETGSHWHSRTWCTTCHCWQPNRRLITHLSTPLETASHPDRGHKPEVSIVFVFQPVFFFFFYPLLNWHLHWASFNSLKKNTATVSSSIKVVFYQDKHTGGATDWKTHLFMYVQYNPSQSTGKHYNSWCCNK